MATKRKKRAIVVLGDCETWDVADNVNIYLIDDEQLDRLRNGDKPRDVLTEQNKPQVIPLLDGEIPTHEEI